MKLRIGKVGIVALTAMIGVLSPIPAKAETLYAPHGARGDFGTELRCPPDHYVVGFEGGIGQIIDRIAIRCAAIASDGTAMPASFTSEVPGGGGGGPAQAACPTGQVAVKGRVFLNKNRKQVYLFGFTCQSQSTSEFSRELFFGGGQPNSDTVLEKLFVGEDVRNFLCKPGEAMTGLTVRHGEHVNALGLICDRFTGRKPAPGPSVAPIQAFQGGWQTVTNQNGHFTLILQIANPGQNPFLTDTYVTGQFINTDGATQYNGIIQGTIPRGTRTLHYSYSQPQIKAGGQGHFTLSNDGNAIAGNGTAGGQTFTWNGTRAR